MSWSPAIGLALGATLLLLVATGVFLFVRRRTRIARELGDPELLRRLMGVDLRRVPWTRLLLVGAASIALAVALLDPRWGRGGVAGRSVGGPVVLVIDVSSSMLVEDTPPSRLAWARATAGELVEALGDAPVGIVVFAGRAYALTPPTRDPGAVDLYLDALDTQMITQTGSALAGALRQGVGLLLAGEAEGGSLVVLSDGNTMEQPGELEAAVNLARRAQIPVITVGVGTPAGGPVPDLDPVTGERLGYKRDAGGESVESRLSEGVLRAVASETGGAYLAARAASPSDLAELVQRAAGRVSGSEGTERPARFAWFAALALLLLVLEGVMGRSPRPAGRSAIVALLLFTFFGCDRPAGDPGAESSHADSIATYRQMATARPGDPLPLYNLGSALLQRDSFEAARRPLEAATRAPSADLRQRAHYNVGNTRLEPFFVAAGALAPADPETRLQALRESVEAYRQALKLEPGDMDAKWNLELALRLLREERTPPPDPPDPPEPEGAGEGGGGGGGGSGAGGGGSSSASANQNPQPRSGDSGLQRPSMTRAEAEELLDNAQDRELGVQRATLEKPQPAGGVAH